jgi:hypothetical protein
MPVHMYTIKARSTGRSVLVYGRLADGGAARGLEPASISAAYVRDAGGSAVDIAAPVTEVDGELAPGVYRLALPDAVLAQGANRAMVVVRHDRAQFDPVDIDLVMYDPQDPVRLGMTALGPKERIAALRGAFPRLSELELKERAGMTEPTDCAKRQDGHTARAYDRAAAPAVDIR